MRTLTAAAGPLLYLQSRLFVHNLRAVLRSPARLAMWLGYLAYLAVFSYARAARWGDSSHGTSSDGGGALAPDPAAAAAPPPLDPSTATLVAGGYVLFLGLVVAGILTKSGIGAFTSRADARFLTGSALPPRLVVFWMQLRLVAGMTFRTLLSAAVWALIALPHTLSNAAVLRLGAVVVLALLALASLILPVGLLGKRIGAAPLVVAGSLIALFGAVVTVGRLGDLLPTNAIPHGLVAVSARVDLGGALNAALAGRDHGALLIALAGVAAFAVVAAVYATRDAYPELYELSLTSFAFRAARARRFGRPASDAGTPAERKRGARERRPVPEAIVRRRDGSEPSAAAPPGAWTLLWKDWLALRRGSTSLASALIGLSFWTGCGVVIGTLARAGGVSTGAAFSLIGFCVNVLVFGTAFSSVAIAEDLRQPLWWLGADGLRQRLYVWTFATSWRTALSITAAIALSALGFNACWLVVLAPVLGIGIAWLLRAVGLGTYALVPSPVDERGPLVFVKSFVLVGLVVPAIAAGLVIALLLAGHRIPNAAPIATLAALLVGTAESVALIELARRRFAGDGARFGLIAQR